MNNLCNDISPGARLTERSFSAFILLAALLINTASSAAGTEAVSQQKRKPQPQKSKQAAEAAKPQPRLSIDKTEHDFGEVYAGELLEVVFAARNTGVAPLELFDGGPVGVLEKNAPEIGVKTVSFNGPGFYRGDSFHMTTARMRAAPS
jgi:hypothetical protein